jgi:hypothetical protein
MKLGHLQQAYPSGTGRMAGPKAELGLLGHGCRPLASSLVGSLLLVFLILLPRLATQDSMAWP